MKKLNLIQDIPTIHNNNLIAKLKNKFQVYEYYALLHDANRYNNKESIANSDSIEYGLSLNLKFIKNILLSKDKILLVGYMNINTKLLLLLLFIFRKKFIYWTDLPIKKTSKLDILKNYIAINVLKKCNVDICCVGKVTIDYFTGLGFDTSNLFNLPILVDVVRDVYKPTRFQSLELNANHKLSIFTGSRLVYDKGFDLLINSITLLPDYVKENISVEIAGDGPELNNLINLTNNLDLKNVIFSGWLEEDEFIERLKNANVVVQPSRFDAFGLAIYGMAYGKVVIGSDKSGAAIERITDGLNGYIYRHDDLVTLANLLENLYNQKNLIEMISTNALEEAKKWELDYINNLIGEII